MWRDVGVVNTTAILPLTRLACTSVLVATSLPSMHAVYARRRTYQHKLIKFGVLLVVCVVFLSASSLFVDSSSDGVDASTEWRETNSGAWYEVGAFGASGGRSLKASSETCVKPRSRGSRASICAFVASHCPMNSGGYINYLNIFFCSKWLGGNEVLAWVTIVAWILFLFLALGTISNDYFVPALTSMAYSLSIPAEIAGLTLLAFGNGAPNVAGYFASVTNKTFDLAIGDVFGGTFYVITVVLSSVCIFGRNIKLDGHSFVRDILFLTAAVVAVFIFIWTGRFYIYESVALLVFYLAYVLWASIHDLMRQRKERLALKRAQAAAGIQAPSKRSYRSRSSVFKKQTIDRLQATIPSILEADSLLSKDSINKLTKKKSSTSTKSHDSTSPTSSKRHLSADFGTDPNTTPKEHHSGNASSQGVAFSPSVEIVHNDTPKPLEQNGHGNSGQASNGTEKAETPTPTEPSPRPHAHGILPKLSTRTLRAAFAKVSDTDALIGHAVTAELNAEVEDILAPPLSGRDVEDNAQSDGTLIIPNVHLYQDAMEEELEETQQKGAYVWTVGHWKTQFSKLALIGKAYYIWTYPMNVPLFLTIPTTRWNRATALASLVLGWPIIFGALGFMKSTIKSIDFPIVTVCIAGATVIMLILFFLTDTDKPPKFKIVFLFWAFIMSVAWIYLIATELINALQAIGRILSIADILLGATVLTWGNSISDFVADSSLAASGEARIAMGALYGGPMFNVAFGIGTATLYATIKSLPGYYSVTPSILFWLMGAFLLFTLLLSFLVVTFVLSYRLRWYYAFPLLYLYITYFVIVVLYQTGTIWAHTPYA